MCLHQSRNLVHTEQILGDGGGGGGETVIELTEKNTRKRDFVVNVKTNRVSRDSKIINQLNYYQVFR